MGGGWSKNKGGSRGPGELEEKPMGAAAAGDEATPTGGTTPGGPGTEGTLTSAPTDSLQPSNNENQSAGAMGDFVEAVVAKASEFGDNE